MDKIGALLAYLDGKKTYLGGFLLWLSAKAQAATVAAPLFAEFLTNIGIPAETVARATAVLLAVSGGTLVVIGAVHKGWKLLQGLGLVDRGEDWPPKILG